MKRLRNAARVLAAVALVIVACRPAPRSGTAAPDRTGDMVRVGLVIGVSEAVVVARGRFRGDSDGAKWELYDGASLAVRAEGDRVVGRPPGGPESAATVQLEPQGEARLLVAGVPYRGSFRITAKSGKLSIIETLPIETYLRGVVPWEIGWLDAARHAAMEAQAIAARTYTCARLGQFPDFDVWADERDQVYKGESRTSEVVDQALRKTRGQVLRFDGQLIQAYYSSTCGGHTSRIENVWAKPPAAYLRGLRDAGADGASYCAESPHFRWTESWSGAALEATLRETVPRVLKWAPGRKLGALLDLRIATRDESGRVLDLDVVTADEVVRLHGDSIRWALRPQGRALLRSIMFDLEFERGAGGALTRVVARGGGNGHGVGMCQTGALALARRGADAVTILQHYYPGTHIESAY